MNAIVSQFYASLADAAGQPLPRRLRHGLPLHVDGAMVRVQVTPYCGTFATTDDGDVVIPRVTVWTTDPWPILELNVVFDRLPVWAPWLWAWLRARAEGLPETLPTPPDVLWCNWPAAVLVRCNYLWTAAAWGQYAARWPQRKGTTEAPPPKG